ncbi:MAG: hypothetical protein AAF702_24090 [Chloroflexota bacterium]
MRSAVAQMNLSTRVYYRVLKPVRTINEKNQTNRTYRTLEQHFATTAGATCPQDPFIFHNG